MSTKNDPHGVLGDSVNLELRKLLLTPEQVAGNVGPIQPPRLPCPGCDAELEVIHTVDLGAWLCCTKCGYGESKGTLS